MNLPSGADDGVPHSTLRLPDGDWPSVLACLCACFPAITETTWRQRMSAGRVLDADLRPLTIDAPYQHGATVRYFRDVEHEPPLPGGECVIHIDDDLVVSDKPHFLPVQPAGRFVRQTLLVRLRETLGNDDLVPLHRIDRATAGLVLFSARPSSRARYQRLFAERRVDKVYEAIAPALPALDFPLQWRSRLVRGEPFFRMCEVPGDANAVTHIDVLAREGPGLPAGHWLYQLRPATGRKHQLRVHMAALGAPILNDPWYPSVRSVAGRVSDDLDAPLQLLARAVSFGEPLRRFVSGRSLS